MEIRNLQELTENLIERGFVFETRGIVQRHRHREHTVSVGNTDPITSEILVIEGSVEYYLELIKQDRISWVLFDASLIQIRYATRSKSIVSHRYCFVPAPFDIDLREVGEYSPNDLIEAGSTRDPLR
jgi:hypothetical protein